MSQLKLSMLAQPPNKAVSRIADRAERRIATKSFMESLVLTSLIVGPDDHSTVTDVMCQPPQALRRES